MDLGHILWFLVGAGIVLLGSFWSMAIFLDQGKEPPYAARLVFTAVRDAMYGLSKLGVARRFREYLLSLYLPVSLLAIVILSLITALIGFTFMFYGLGAGTFTESYVDSASSLSVLGIGGSVGNISRTTLALIEAFTGPILVALLIGYLASINSSFSQDEGHMSKLRSDAGRNNWAAGILESLSGKDDEQRLDSLFNEWKIAFENLEKLYRSLDGYLLIFSPKSRDSHVHAAALTLNAAALRSSVVDKAGSEEALQCIEVGSRVLTSAAMHFGKEKKLGFENRWTGSAADREDFKRAIDEISANGIPVRQDRDMAWQDFSQLRAQYDPAVSLLLNMTHSEPVSLSNPNA